MQILEKDILTVTDGVIVHQVNCKGKMGAGLAFRIAKKWPLVKEEYLRLGTFIGYRLGGVQLIKITDSLFVCNLFGQNRYGLEQQHTNYEAVETSLERLKNLTERQIYIPYMMGCRLGGGSWPEVLKIIERTIPEAIICRY
jgi:O-acetyl-ADP-ribose deacetylase (regulator of RNase III)